MNNSNLLIEEAKCAPKTLGYKLKNNLATLEDQEEALTNPEWSYIFAFKVKGADIKKLEDAVMSDPKLSYVFACDVPGADIKKLEDAVISDPKWSYYFTYHIPGANRERLRKACKGTDWEF